MHRHGVVCADGVLIPDIFINLIDGKYPALIFNLQKQNIIFNRSQLHLLSVHTDFLGLIVDDQPSCLINMSALLT